MKTSIHVTALNATELALIEDAVAVFFEQLYAYAQRYNINLPDFSGEISWCVCDLEMQPRCVCFNFGFDEKRNVGGGANLCGMDGIGEEILLEIISSKIRSLLLILFNGKMYFVGRDPERHYEMVHVGK